MHLTLNAENADYRWGPLTHAPSLLSGEGGFPRTLDDLWEHADPDEVDRELRTQVERALAWGIDVTHLAPHLSAITLRPEFFDIYIGLAVDFALPVRLPSTITAEQAGFPFRKLAADEGVVFPDHFDHDWRPGSRDRVTQTLANLPAGVTEIHIQPAIDSPEVRGFSAAAEAWIDDLALALDPALPAQLDAAGADDDRLPRAPRRHARRLSTPSGAQNDADADSADATTARSAATWPSNARRPSSVRRTRTRRRRSASGRSTTM